MCVLEKSIIHSHHFHFISFHFFNNKKLNLTQNDGKGSLSRGWVVGGEKYILEIEGPKCQGERKRERERENEERVYATSCFGEFLERIEFCLFGTEDRSEKTKLNSFGLFTDSEPPLTKIFGFDSLSSLSAIRLFLRISPSSSPQERSENKKKFFF